MLQLFVANLILHQLLATISIYYLPHIRPNQSLYIPMDANLAAPADLSSRSYPNYNQDAGEYHRGKSPTQGRRRTSTSSRHFLVIL
jgi:hypothetical protein